MVGVAVKAGAVGAGVLVGAAVGGAAVLLAATVGSTGVVVGTTAGRIGVLAATVEQATTPIATVADVAIQSTGAASAVETVQFKKQCRAEARHGHCAWGEWASPEISSRRSAHFFHISDGSHTTGADRLR